MIEWTARVEGRVFYITGQLLGETYEGSFWPHLFSESELPGVVLDICRQIRDYLFWQADIW